MHIDKRHEVEVINVQALRLSLTIFLLLIFSLESSLPLHASWFVLILQYTYYQRVFTHRATTVGGLLQTNKTGFWLQLMALTIGLFKLWEGQRWDFWHILIVSCHLNLVVTSLEASRHGDYIQANIAHYMKASNRKSMREVLVLVWYQKKVQSLFYNHWRQ